MSKAEYLKFTKGIVDATRGLIGRVPADRLDWRPDPSFLKLSAVLHHVSHAVGSQLRDVMNEPWEYRPAGSAGDANLPPADAFLPLTAEHLSNHRMQLFLYLRLLGVKVGTPELYGG